jgi:hypothetical protein
MSELLLPIAVRSACKSFGHAKRPFTVVVLTPCRVRLLRTHKRKHE